MQFFLGTDEPAWLKRTDVPLFLSRRRLARLKRPGAARGEWALDSGGFTEIARYGCWQTPAKQYVAEVRQWREQIGHLRWAAIQDWMCEPFMLAKTGKSIGEHQQLTVNSWGLLNALDGSIPWLPVLQGWTVWDYVAHAELYRRHTATDLSQLPTVGLGSVCRRQATEEIVDIARELTGMGIRLHGFGVKINGLRQGLSALLDSADSMAWSFAGRRRGSLETCDHICSAAHCLPFALRWREKILRAIGSGQRRYQPTMF